MLIIERPKKKRTKYLVLGLKAQKIVLVIELYTDWIAFNVLSRTVLVSNIHNFYTLIVVPISLCIFKIKKFKIIPL